MSIYSWLQNLRSPLDPHRGRRPRRHAARSAQRRLTLEVLVHRLTPSLVPYSVDYEEPPGVAWANSSTLMRDFTSDGIVDRLSTMSDSEVTVEPGLGDGTYGDPIFSYAPYAGALAVADFDGDCRLDVATVALVWGTPNVVAGSVLLGQGDGTFLWWNSYEIGAQMAYPDRIGTFDFNGDGRTDLVVGGWTDFYASDDTFQLIVNDGDWASEPPQESSLTIGDVTVTEGNAGAISAAFTVTLSEASSQTITVAYATGDGSATADSDYQSAVGTLTFGPGETSKTITVLVSGDRLGEPNENFLVNLSSATNATIADGQAVGVIRDDEPHVSISDVTKNEGKSGKTTLFTFTVTLSAAYDQPVTMSFATRNGTATSGDNDYIAKSGTLTFAPGETTKSITIQVKGDSKKEAHETFYLDLFGLSSAAFFDKYRGIGTIVNDD